MKPSLMRPLILLAALALAAPAAAREPETPLARALSCQVDDSAVATLMPTLAAENAG